jgi:hypothetical protein
LPGAGYQLAESNYEPGLYPAEKGVESAVLDGFAGLSDLRGPVCVRSAFLSYYREINRTGVAEITLESRIGGEPVDLNPLLVRWKSQGEAQLLTAYLENIQTGQRSRAYQVHSADRSVTFCTADYSRILTVRNQGGHNRVRAVLESPSQTFASKEFNVLVGIVLLLVATPEKTTLAATIDNTLVQGYQFEAKVLLHKKSSGALVTLGGDITAKRDFVVAAPASIDWSLTKVVYLGRDDQQTIRTSFLIDHADFGILMWLSSAVCSGPP